MQNINLCHYDLDGVASLIVVKKFVGGNKNFYGVPTGYGRLDSRIDEIIRDLKEPTNIFVTDLRLDPEQINRLVEPELVKRVIYADHHPVDDDWKEWMENSDLHKKLKIYWDDQRCGAQIIYDVLWKAFGKQYPDIEELVRIANIYDLWNDTHHEFEIGINTNNLFWEIGFWNFVKEMKDGWNITEKSQNIIDKNIIDRDIYIKDTIENFTMTSEVEDVTIALIVNPECKFLNDFKHFNPQFDVCIIFGGDREGGQNWSLRTSDAMLDRGISCQDFAEQMTKQNDEVDGGGHPAASGIFINSTEVRLYAERLLNWFESYVSRTLSKTA